MIKRFVIFLTNCIAPIFSVIFSAIQELILKVDLTGQLNHLEHNEIHEKIHFIVPEEFFTMTPEQLQATIDAMVALEFTRQQ